MNRPYIGNIHCKIPVVQGGTTAYFGKRIGPILGSTRGFFSIIFENQKHESVE